MANALELVGKKSRGFIITPGLYLHIMGYGGIIKILVCVFYYPLGKTCFQDYVLRGTLYTLFKNLLKCVDNICPTRLYPSSVRDRVGFPSLGSSAYGVDPK